MSTPETAADQTGAKTAEKAKRTAQELSDSPAALVAGGIAIGVVVGLLLPRHGKERELLGSVGQKLADRASAAAQTARSAGKQELGSLLPSGTDTKDRVSALFGSVLDAARGTTKA